MGQSQSAPNVEAAPQQRRSRVLRRMSDSVHRHFKRHRGKDTEPMQGAGSRSPPRVDPPPIPATPHNTLPPSRPTALSERRDLDTRDKDGPNRPSVSSQSSRAESIGSESFGAFHQPEFSELRDTTERHDSPDPTAAADAHSNAPTASDDEGGPEDAYVLLLGRLLAIVASMTAATLSSGRPASGQLHGLSADTEDRSFMGFLDSLTNGSRANELSEAMFSGNSSHIFFRVFSFPEDDQGLVPILIIGVRAADGSHDEDYDEDDPAFPHLPLGRNSPSQSSSSTDAGGTESHTRQAWVIYVVGNAYPSSHPIFNAPTFRTRNPTLDDIRAFEELLTRPTDVATQKDVDKSGGLSYIEEETDNACSICLQNYMPGEAVRTLSCKHAYHQECVDTWLTGSHNTCPTCRIKGVQVE